MKIHELKAWPEYFTAMKNGLKTFDFRINDRNFQVGNFIMFLEWDTVTQDYTDIRENRLLYKITYIMKGGKFGLEEGFVCMSIIPYKTPAAPGRELDGRIHDGWPE